jgi:hypothetical protein
MFSMLVIGILGSMVGLVLYELIDEIRGSKNKLHDHYHE